MHIVLSDGLDCMSSITMVNFLHVDGVLLGIVCRCVVRYPTHEQSPFGAVHRSHVQVPLGHLLLSNSLISDNPAVQARYQEPGLSLR